MSTIGFYFPLSHEDTNALRARLNAIAAKLGYTATRGPTAGQGNLPELLAAIDAGEVALVQLPPVPQAWAMEIAEWLEGQALNLRDGLGTFEDGPADVFFILELAEALEAIAMSLREALSRQSTTPDKSKSDGSGTSTLKSHPRV